MCASKRFGCAFMNKKLIHIEKTFKEEIEEMQPRKIQMKQSLHKFPVHGMIILEDNESVMDRNNDLTMKRFEVNDENDAEKLIVIEENMEDNYHNVNMKTKKQQIFCKNIVKIYSTKTCCG